MVNHEYPLRNSDLTMYTTGEQLFSDLFEEIHQATNHIHVEFYILQDDKFSKEFVNLLTSKSKEGVEVRLLLDWVGSKNVTKEMEKTLTDAGVLLSYSNKPTFPYLFYKLNARNHRKISIIDGKTGYIGGFNVGKEYLGQDKEFGFWRDYHLKMTGEGVADLQTQFLKDWVRATNEVFTNQDSYYPQLHQGNMETKLSPTDGAYLEDNFIHLIKQAEKEIIIGSPYFVPSERIKRELINAAKKNIKIRVLLPQKPDHPFVKEAAYPYMDELTKEGIHFFMYTKGFYHAKAICIDDKICDIGTANFDKRSLYSNYEINCFIYDKEFIAHIKNRVAEDFANSTELTREEIDQDMSKKWLLIKLSTLFSHFL